MRAKTYAAPALTSALTALLNKRSDWSLPNRIPGFSIGDTILDKPGPQAALAALVNRLLAIAFPDGSAVFIQPGDKSKSLCLRYPLHFRF